MGFSQSAVSKLLGHKYETTIVRYENGELLPTFETALRLEIIYRTPVAFLFPGLYESLRTQLRAREVATVARTGQQSLL
jgi:hypothetical protein